jgi:hypothetical protein
LDSTKNKVVSLKEAIIYYVDGYKVRRYITDEMFAQDVENQKINGDRRIPETNIWKNIWVWHEDGRKTCTDIDLVDRIFTPLESFTRMGPTNSKLWEVKPNIING